MEDITDADYIHSKLVCKDFQIKRIGEYRDLYVQSGALLSDCNGTRTHNHLFRKQTLNEH